ncbi:MAG: fibronectin type III domain-containing protein [Candidatus Alcyoniella australis]|nr:fibronectin type III domain-containing protein [Candidatus Alcyoniella australis]
MDVQLRKMSFALVLLCAALALIAYPALAQDNLPAPTGLKAEIGQDGRSILISWEPLGDELGAKGYNIFHGPDADRMVQVAKGYDRTEFSDSGVGPNIPYFYKVEAIGPNGPGEAAVIGPIMISAQIPVPAPPRALAAFDSVNDSGHSIHLVWQASSDDNAGSYAVNGYEIYRSASPEFDQEVWIGTLASGQTAKLLGFNVGAYEDAAKAGEPATPDSMRYLLINASVKQIVEEDPKYVSNSVPYYYRVVAKVQGESEPTACSGAVIVAPPKPGDWVKAAPGINGGIDLTWEKSPDDGLYRQIVESYQVYRAADSAGLEDSANLLADVDAVGNKDSRPRKQTWTDRTAQPGVAYFYRVVTTTTGATSVDNPVTAQAVAAQQPYVAPPEPAMPDKELDDQQQATESGEESVVVDVDAGDAAATAEAAADQPSAVEPQVVEPAISAAPPQDVLARDVRGDFGSRILISFRASPDETLDEGQPDESFIGYEVLRSEDPSLPFEGVALQPALGRDHYFLIDDKDVLDGVPYYYLVIVKKVEGDSESVLANNGSPAMAYTDKLPPAPPSNVQAVPIVTDASRMRGRIKITWDLSPDDPVGSAGRAGVTGYDIYRATKENIDSGEFQLHDHVPTGTTEYLDLYVSNRTSFAYRVVAVSAVTSDPVITAEAVESHPQWFDMAKLPYFVVMLIISFAIIFFIEHAKKGRKMFIRKIAGLEAVDDAIGRATEMGKNIMFVPGIMDINDVQTLASLTILSRIAKTIAEHDTQLNVPTSKSLVMTTAREVVKEAFLEAGRPDAYNVDNITYLTDDQFGYVAGVTGMMVRDKPATCFFLGSFYAESLILAETGNLIGAIQIAGTAQPAQLPFFIAACDYTLIGEELFAASAYLSGEPRQLGSLKGQDIGKGIAMFAIVFGGILETISQFILSANPESTSAIVRFSHWFRELFALPN